MPNPSGETMAGQKNLKNKKPPIATFSEPGNFLPTIFFKKVQISRISLFF